GIEGEAGLELGAGLGVVALGKEIASGPEDCLSGHGVALRGLRARKEGPEQDGCADRARRDPAGPPYRPHATLCQPPVKTVFGNKTSSFLKSEHRSLLYPG